MTATNREYIDATEADPFESGISRTADPRERGNAAPSEARVLARYSARDDELTKPSVMLLDWCGDDEVTVRWDSVRHQLPSNEADPALNEADPTLAGFDEDELEAQRFRGIGARAGGVLLGLVLGVAVTIGTLAIFAPRTAPDDPSAGPDATVQAGVNVASFRPSAR